MIAHFLVFICIITFANCVQTCNTNRDCWLGTCVSKIAVGMTSFTIYNACTVDGPALVGSLAALVIVASIVGIYLYSRKRRIMAQQMIIIKPTESGYGTPAMTTYLPPYSNTDTVHNTPPIYSRRM